MNLGRLLEEVCERFADRIAIIHESRSLSYRELERSVNAVAVGLRNRGLAKGDTVAILLPNCPEFVIAYYAMQKIGAVPVTLNVQSTPYELGYFLRNSDARGVVTTSLLAKRLDEITEEDLSLCRHIVRTDDPEEAGAFQGEGARGRGPFPIPEIGEDDPAAMIYTSGLTGQPLGAVLTQRNLLTQSEVLRRCIDGTESDRNLSIIPFFHSFGASVNMLATICIGGSMVLMERFTLEGIFSAIERERVTYIAAVPRLFLGMLLQEGAEKYDVSSLRLCITGGAPMPPEFIPQFAQRFSTPLLEGYGLTEGSPVTTFTRLRISQKPGSIGVAIPGVETKVFGDDERELAPGEIGELVVKGENVMKGYYRDEEATAKVIRDGWLHTGDLAYMDAEGYVFLTGRKKRMIITSGFNVYPQEVETILRLHPAVKDARVVSQPDLIRGEIVKALIVADPRVPVEEKEVMKHCRTYLSSYKLPREIEFVAALEQ
jgi:long-chain acyl-CoA synthetase